MVLAHTTTYPKHTASQWRKCPLLWRREAVSAYIFKTPLMCPAFMVMWSKLRSQKIIRKWDIICGSLLIPVLTAAIAVLFSVYTMTWHPLSYCSHIICIYHDVAPSQLLQSYYLYIPWRGTLSAIAVMTWHPLRYCSHIICIYHDVAPSQILQSYYLYIPWRGTLSIMEFNDIY